MIGNLKRKVKKGLFLSVETVVVIIIIIAIAAVIVAGIAHLFKMYKVYQISRDVSQYSEAFIQFKVNYRYLAGDVPNSKLQGNLADPGILAETAAATFTTGTKMLPQGKLGKENGTLLSFRELFAAKLINANISLPIAAQGGATGCVAIATLVSNGIIPPSSFDDSIAWIPISENNTTDGPKGLSIVTSIQSLMPTSKARLYLIRYSSLTTATDCGFDFSVAGKAIGSISPNIASELDIKIDDGKPSGATSALFAENYGATNTCTDYATAPTAADTATNIYGIKYNSSTDDSGSKGCVLSYVVNTEA